LRARRGHKQTPAAEDGGSELKAGLKVAYYYHLQKLAKIVIGSLMAKKDDEEAEKLRNLSTFWSCITIPCLVMPLRL